MTQVWEFSLGGMERKKREVNKLCNLSVEKIFFIIFVTFVNISVFVSKELPKEVIY